MLGEIFCPENKRIRDTIVVNCKVIRARKKSLRQAIALAFLHLLVKIVDELLEDERIDVLAELVEQEPIAEAGFTADALDLVHGRQARSSPKEDLAESGRKHDDEAVDDLDAGDDAHDDEPEPQEDVNLFVNDVQGQDAQTVELLDRTGRTEFVERALGDFGKDSSHRIFAFLWLQLRHGQHVGAVRREFSAEKEIHEVNLSDDVDKVENLAQEELVGVEFVVVAVDGEVFDEKLDAIPLRIRIDDGYVHVLDQHLDLATLPRFPKVTRDVEENGLEEKGETHPLVVFVVAHFLALSQVAGRSDSGVGDVMAFLSGHAVRNGEGRMDPAIRIHDIVGNLLDDTVDGIAE